MTTPWQTIVATALLGTERQALALPQVDGRLGEVLGALHDRSPEATLLGAAAALRLFQHAGSLLPQTGEPVPAPAEPDTLPRCSPQATHLLGTILSDSSYQRLLPEWLAAASAARQRIPEPWLPVLLDAGRRSAAIRPALVAVIGQRGNWLAAQNPDWSYAVGGEDDREIWEHGPRAARLLALERIRAVDPQGARELLAASFGKESAADRAAMLEQFVAGLSMADEPFLEGALDDRSQEVRRVAAELLSRLPASRLAARMAARVAPLVSFREQKRLFGLMKSDLQLDVTLPDGTDQATIRDGINVKNIAGKSGEKGKLLSALLTAAPLDMWTESPDALVAAAIRDTTWGRLIIESWITAAILQGNQRWARALVPATVKAFGGYLVTGLVDLYPPAAREAMAREYLEQRSASLEHVSGLMTQSSAFPWSADFSRLFITRMAEPISQAAAGAAAPWWPSTNSLIEWALRIDPALSDEVSHILTAAVGSNEVWARMVRTALAILHFRNQIHIAFQPANANKEPSA